MAKNSLIECQYNKKYLENFPAGKMYECICTRHDFKNSTEVINIIKRVKL